MWIEFLPLFKVNSQHESRDDNRIQDGIRFPTGARICFFINTPRLSRAEIGVLYNGLSRVERETGTGIYLFVSRSSCISETRDLCRT
jgi:hypothetical protein